MSLIINNRAVSTGRAKCKVCDEFIKKGIFCIFVRGFHTEAHCHIKCPGR